MNLTYLIHALLSMPFSINKLFQGSFTERHEVEGSHIVTTPLMHLLICSTVNGHLNYIQF
jgi:hypothetical protein